METSSRKIIPVPDFNYFVFGATGDLARRKLMPALYHRFADGQIPPSAKIIGCARSEFDDDGYREVVAQSIEQHVLLKFHNPKVLKEFLAMVRYQRVDLNDQKSWEALSESEPMKEKDRITVFYLAVAPSLFMPIINGLKANNLNTHSRLVVEKPLGRNQPEARELNAVLLSAYDEGRIYRIDHYLGKETVQNLMALRFANALFEPLWNSKYIGHVQITASESIGMGGREEYYDRCGAMRDMVQNHLLQLLCLTAMEPPASYEADRIRDEKLKVLRSLKPIVGHKAISQTCRGQYRGNHESPSYRDEAKNPHSMTESYVAIRSEIDNWRWSGTPFYLRTGKRLRTAMAEICIVFRSAPHCIFGELDTPIHPNALAIRLQPDERIDFEIMTKQPGPGGMRLRRSVLDTSSEGLTDKSARMPDAYERLLMDVVRGNQTLFMRGDEVEEAWAWVDPIIDAWETSGVEPESYDIASEGPIGAFNLIAQSGHRWRSIQ